ncbi:MAG: hypothetical protein OXH04_08325 [Acidobacteria bacterium]|nr:hypothetical protein [Acidobacteriota bacterium]
MHSRVLLAEGELERRLRAAARQSLGRDATVAQVDAAVARMQRGPRRSRAAEETYVRRLVREDTRRLEATQFRRWKTLPRECFPTANPLLLADKRDTQITTDRAHPSYPHAA